MTRRIALAGLLPAAAWLLLAKTLVGSSESGPVELCTQVHSGGDLVGGSIRVMPPHIACYAGGDSGPSSVKLWTFAWPALYWVVVGVAVARVAAVVARAGGGALRLRSE